jgi:prophage regulatory protein
VITMRSSRQVSDQVKQVKKTGRLVYQPEVLDQIGLSRVHIWQLEQRGKFPRRLEVGGLPAWYEDEISDWLAALPRRRLKGDAA